MNAVEVLLSLLGFFSREYPEVNAFVERLLDGDATEIEKVRATLRGNTAREWLKRHGQ